MGTPELDLSKIKKHFPGYRRASKKDRGKNYQNGGALGGGSKPRRNPALCLWYWR
jgi:hypothetical protein